ncbi:MAG: trypsin-like peptidase domain-containing protein [Planctomycetes bacterium]|nr:trypsin-like peptidase domain-containing protein [Planctomycetota bacterium]
MSRLATCVLCVNALVLGLLWGSSGEFRIGRPLQAEQSEGTAVDRGYRDLANRSALLDSSEHLAKISRLTTNSVVHIQSERKTPRGRMVEETGSGVIMESTKAKGFYVVSNKHVIDETPLENISIHLHDGRVIHPTKVWTDKASDVAIMRVNQTNLQASRWGDSDKVEIGHLVLAMGSPFGLSQSVTLGIISAKGRRSLKMPDSSDMINQDFLQTDAAINPGNSGGPLIDMQGQVIGINTAIASQSGGNEGIGFSIPSNLVRRVIDQLLENGKVTRAYIGVSLDDDFTEEEAANLKLDRLRGARVVSLYPKSPAAKADIKKDDVILTYDGVEVLDENHLINMVSLTPVGRKVKVVVFRDGKHLTLEVTVADRQDFEVLRQRSEAPTRPGEGTRFESLGLTLHQLDPELAPQLGFDPSAQGLLVLKVDRDGPLDGELKLYDLIEEVARTPVTSIEDLRAALDQATDSEMVLLTVKRRSNNGKVQSQVVTYHRQ